MRHLTWSGFVVLMACGSSDPDPTPEDLDESVVTIIPDAGVLVPAPPTSPKPCPIAQQNGDRVVDSIVAGPWIRDCNAPHPREYYRVHTQPDGSARVLPRPNNTPAIDHVCKTASSDLRPRLDRYGWCDNSVDPERIDHMTVDDALALAHRLHLDLRFRGAHRLVWPDPMPDDAALVCGATDPDMLEACIYYLPRDPRRPLGLLGGPSERAAIKLAAALNRLYGIK
jgi:hypothetical protein